MFKIFAGFLVIVALAACSDPRDHLLPKDGNFKAVEPYALKLNEEEQTLLAAYLVRMTLPKDSTIPAGTTIRTAIEHQREFNKQESLKRK